MVDSASCNGTVPPVGGINADRPDHTFFQLDVQGDVRYDFLGWDRLFQHERGKGIHWRLVPGVKALKGVLVHLGNSLDSRRSSSDL